MFNLKNICLLVLTLCMGIFIGIEFEDKSTDILPINYIVKIPGDFEFLPLYIKKDDKIKKIKNKYSKGYRWREGDMEL